MITIFNRKMIYTDSSAQDRARVEQLLQAAGIPYTVKTLRNTSTFGMNMHNAMLSRQTMAGHTHRDSVGPQTFVYQLFVAKKDADRALQLIRTSGAT